jgi:hypothetical protein
MDLENITLWAYLKLLFLASQVVQAIPKNDKDVVSVSATGSVEVFVDKLAAIVEGKHRAIVTNIKPDGDFEKLFQNKDIMSKEVWVAGSSFEMNMGPYTSLWQNRKGTNLHLTPKVRLPR